MNLLQHLFHRHLSNHFHTWHAWIQDPSSAAAFSWACSELISLLPMFIPQCNSTQESWKSLVCWSSPMLSALPGPSLLPFRWHVGREERERNMLSLLTWIRRPSLFVCSYWDLALIVPGDPFQKEKERWSAWRRRRAVQCGLFWHIHVTLVGHFRIWKLCLTLSCPKCRSFKRDRNTAASHCGNREG